MAPWKNRLVIFTIALQSVSLPIFLVTGCIALYWAWPRGNLQAALPYLPLARNSGMLAITGAAMAFAILFSSHVFRVSPKTRLALSLLGTSTIAFFSEFRNEGKFHLRKLVHFFGPGTWIHDRLEQTSSSVADFLYRIEYSHLNDFLMGPAIVSVLYALVFFKIAGASWNDGPISLSATEPSTEHDAALRFARNLMNVGLFWFFIHAWAEKAGYLSNPHSRDEIDLPFEFAGTMLGFWMARILTKPFDGRSETFRSTLVVDFVCSGVIGLIYTFVVGSLTEGVASTVAHALYPTVPGSLDMHEYTAFQQHTRPFELVLLAGAMWWGLNRIPRQEEMTSISGAYSEATPASNWAPLITTVKALGVAIAYLLLLFAMLFFLEPQGLGWTLATAAAGLAVEAGALLLIRRAGRRGLTTLFGRRSR